MKRLKEFLELLVAFVKAWPFLVSILLLLLSLIISFSKLANVRFQFSLSLPLLITVAAFVFYPIGKFVQWLVGKPKKTFKYDGLLWKPSKLSFLYPTPLCPHEGCRCEIISKVDLAVSIGSKSGAYIPARGNYHYTFECPIHGMIHGIPDEDIVQLQKKARMVQERNKQ